ncbi:MAG: nucleotide sugar dehydrogenase [Candidatus Omnitrophica bacterium]|nr:nucleotide sugar dehydrogenase [Candidatus Omnitrophota bacterium]
MEKISVLGMGYIGLPTACMLANSGFEVLGVEIDKEIINKLNSGKLHIEEPELEKIFSSAFENNRLRVSLEPERSDVFIIAVPTPLDHRNKADLSYVISAVNKIKEKIKKGNLVILESTSPPGTTRNIVGKMITNSTGFIAGRDYYLAFCPERVLPGKIVYELENNDRIVGGVDKKSSEAAESIYKTFVKGKIFLTDLETSEFVKLAENTYRDINIAFANELSLICKDYGIDIREVIKYANMHPRVKILNPGPGVGGHCIPIDPWFILENTDRKDTLIEKCRKINNSMPFIISEEIAEIVGKYRDPKVTIFGFSYKENVGDIRESSAITINNELMEKGIKVLIYDPLVVNTKYKFSGLEESVKGSDLVLLFSGHSVFRDIDLKSVYNLLRNKNIFDTRNFFDKSTIEKLGFNYYRL